jgi:N-acetylglucosaminyl-diphospho-decaprenol L-rhamnosyltransferase
LLPRPQLHGGSGGRPRALSAFDLDLMLSIVIVSFNAKADLLRCLESLRSAAPSTPHEIIVVDNASSDGSAGAARCCHGVQVIESGGNLGFARGTNLGIRASRGDLLLLLNSDTIPPPRAVDRLVEEIERDPRTAVVGPRLVDSQGRVELSFGRMMGPFNELRQKALVRGHAAGVPGVAGWVERQTRRPACPDWVSGACLLVRRTEAEAVGLLDERYFMYTEDIDFCAAIRARGGLVRFVPTVTVVHARGRSAAAAPLTTQTAYRRSQLAFYQKHHPRWAPVLRWYLRLRGHVVPADQP